MERADSGSNSGSNPDPVPQRGFPDSGSRPFCRQTHFKAYHNEGVERSFIVHGCVAEVRLRGADSASLS
eukprot:2329688-Pyramimonas_sp.AAC.1